MEAIRIKKRIESETLKLPIPKKLIGKDVEIIFLVDPDSEEPEADKTTKKSISRFFGKWKDERSAEEIVSEIRADRERNVRSGKIEL
jgi:hypothetical protein